MMIGPQQKSDKYSKGEKRNVFFFIVSGIKKNKCIVTQRNVMLHIGYY